MHVWYAHGVWSYTQIMYERTVCTSTRTVLYIYTYNTLLQGPAEALNECTAEVCTMGICTMYLWYEDMLCGYARCMQGPHECAAEILYPICGGEAHTFSMRICYVHMLCAYAMLMTRWRSAYTLYVHILCAYAMHICGADDSAVKRIHSLCAYAMCICYAHTRC